MKTQSKLTQSKSFLLGAFTLSSVWSLFPYAAEASIVRINEDAFMPSAGLITFSELPLNTTNPTYNPADYGGDADAATVSFGGFFVGQQLGNAANCPAGAALTGCVVGTPSALLALDGNSPVTRIVTDGANPTSPVLSGTPQFNGPVSILFDIDLAGVGLDGGFFNAVGGTAITAFSRNGTVLGQVLNEGLGIEFLGLVTADGTEQIAGLQFSLVGAEPAGFAIDNLRFGRSDEVVVTPIPEPLTILGSLTAMGIGVAVKKKKQTRR